MVIVENSDMPPIPAMRLETRKARMITPMALMQEKIKSERLLTMVSGSPAASAGVAHSRHSAAVPAAVK